MDLRVETLGRFAVFLNGEMRPSILEQPVRAALLLFLTVDGDVARDQAEAVIWGDIPPDKARHTLNQTLYRLRRDMGEDWLLSKGDRLFVTSRVSVDAREFQEAVGAGSWERALALYRGPFLETWHPPGSSAFEHWADRHRLRLARLFREACRLGIADRTGVGDGRGALEVAERWVQADPSEDEAHHALIHLMATQGRRAEALERYEAFARLLAQDDLEPLDETQALAGAIRNSRPPYDGQKPLVPAPSESAPPADSHPPPREVRRLGRRTLLSLASVLALVVALVVVLPLRQAPTPSARPGRVLVVPLENRTGDPERDAVGWMAADWITQGLAETDFLEVVPAGEVLGGFQVRGFHGQDFADGTLRGLGAAGTDADHLSRSLAAAGENGAGTLVTGAYYDTGAGVELNVQVVEVATRRVVESVGPVRTSTPDVTEAVDILRQRVVVSFALRLDERLDGALAESARPPSYPAYLAFMEGVRKVGMGDWAGALPELIRAHAISPDFVAPLIFVGFAYIDGLGDYGKADSVARIVEASRASLPRYDRLRLDILQATIRGDVPAQYRAAREAAAITPGGTAHFLSAQKALQMNRPREALEILATFDPEREFARQWTPYWNVLTQAHHLLGEHSAELEAARHGQRLVPERVEMLAYEARALVALGRIPEVEQRLDEAASYRPSPLMTPGEAMLMTAQELLAHGHPEAAANAAARALAWWEVLPPEDRDRGRVRILRVRALTLRGEVEAAEAELAGLTTVRPDDPHYLGLLGALAARRGDTLSARRHAETLAALEQPYLLGQHTLARASIEALLGHSEEAVNLLRIAVAQGVWFGTPLHAHPDLQPLRGYSAFETFLEPKG